MPSLDWRRPAPGHRVATPDGPDWPTLGSAIHHRIAFGFGVDPPVAALRGYSLLDTGRSVEDLADANRQGHTGGATATMPDGPLDFSARLGQFVARYDLVAAPQPAGVERTLARVLWVLARWESVYRGDDPASWLPHAAAAVSTWPASDWLALAPDYAVADLAAVADLFTTRGRDDLLDAAGPGARGRGAGIRHRLGRRRPGGRVVCRRGQGHGAPGQAQPDLDLAAVLLRLAGRSRRHHRGLPAPAGTHRRVRPGHHRRGIPGGRDPSVLAGQARDVMREAAASVGKAVP